MAPTKKSPRKLGFVVKLGFRAQVKLNRKHEAGPRRTREADANADLALLRACQTREEIPALLARLRAEAVSGNAPPVAAPRAFGDTTASSAVASHRRAEARSPAVSRRTRAVDGTSRSSSTASTDHSLPPRNLESAFQNGSPRKRLRGNSAGPTPAAAHSPRPQAVASTSSSGMAVLLVLPGLNIQYRFSQLRFAEDSGGTRPSSWLDPPQIAEGLKRDEEAGVAGVPAEGARRKLVVGLVSGHRRSVEYTMFEFTDV